MVIDIVKIGNKIKKSFNDASDFIVLDFDVATLAAKVFYIDGIIDKEVFELSLLKQLKTLTETPKPPYLEFLNKINFTGAPIVAIELKQIDKAIENISAGDIVLMLENGECFYSFSLRKYPKRAIAEPPTSSVLRGPREGFTEDYKTNLTLLRRRLKTNNLVFKNFTLGRYTQSSVAVAYINGIADMNIVNKVIERLKNIDIDGILDSHYVAGFLVENKFSIFNQIGTSEKPDVVTAKLLEGRIAIIVEGSPIVLTLPYVLFESFQDAQDYYIRPSRASFLRLVRIVGQMLAIFLPAIYVAFQEFQYEMLPLKFLLTILNSINGIPLSPTLEMLCVLIIFEILNEASVRMPRYVGMALSIVGAIVLGDTAVKAGLLSSPTVLISALSTIGLYCVPDLTGQGSTLRLLFVAISGVCGIFGVIICFMLLIAYLSSMENYNTAYLSPFAPMHIEDFQDGILKNRLQAMKKRPKSIATQNKKRQR